MDGIVFDKEFAEKYPEVVTAFIDGALQASNMYEKDMKTIKSVMPMFSTASDKDILDNCASAKLTTYADNLKLFTETAKTIYTDMCGVWESIGESVNKDLVNTIFDSKYIEALSAKYDASEYTSTDANVTVTEENKQEVIDATALLTKSTTVNFVANTAKFLDSADASAKLNEFIEIAKVLDGSIIQIEGNIASDNDDASGVELSRQRAETVNNILY
jgi:outer membrane protein OmpA-like peptidoglycan-associated protein